MALMKFFEDFVTVECQGHIFVLQPSGKYLITDIEMFKTKC